MRMINTVEGASRALRRPLERFIRSESSSASLLIGAAVVALIWANVSDSYTAVWNSTLPSTSGRCIWMSRCGTG